MESLLLLKSLITKRTESFSFRRQWKKGKELTEQEKVIIAAKVAEVQAALDKAVMIETVSAIMADLCAGLQSKNAVSDQGAINAVYARALMGISGLPIAVSAEEILRGEAKGMSKRYLPTTAELAAYCRAAEAMHRFYTKEVRKLLELETNK